MLSKQAMAAQFTEVSLDDMDKFIKRGWRALRPKQGTERREVYYDLSLSEFVIIRVWTSIGAGRETGADVGSDAIRIQLLAKKSGRPLTKGKAPIVKRTQGWKNNLQDRIEDFLEMYEDQEGYFEQRAGGEAPAPEPVKTERDEQDEEVREERRPSHDRPDAEATWARLPSGDWGLRVRGRVQPGDRVLVKRKDGKGQYMTVGQIVRTFSDAVLTTVDKTRTASGCCGGTGVRPDGQPCQCGGACKSAEGPGPEEEVYSYDRSV